MATLDRNTLLRLARAGAQSRLAELQSEMESIFRSFPDLKGRGGRQRGARQGSAQSGSPRRRGWTAAQREEAAERMRKYWAARRAAKKR